VQTVRWRGRSGFITERFDQLHIGVAAASGELGEHTLCVAKEIPERNKYCQHLKEIKLTVLEIKKNAAKCLILLGSRGKTLEKQNLVSNSGLRQLPLSNSP